MADFNYDFNSSTVSKPSFKDAGVNNENELNPEMASRLKSPNKKQIPTKHFMSPTVSAAMKANVPKKRILTERNETLDFVEPNSLIRSSSSFGSKPVKFDAVEIGNEDVNLKPYDPINNYLSPRPKFLRYNPNRRRNLSIFKGNEDADSVKSSISSLDVDSGILPSSGLKLVVDSIGSMDSCSNKESVEEVENAIDEKSESEDDETEEEEMVEFEENRCLSLKGFLKFLFVVIAVIVTTQAICSMSLPTDSQTLESVWSLNGSYNNVYGSASSNFCEVEYGLIKEANLVVYKGLDAQIDVVIGEEVENDETNVSQIDIWNKHENTDHLQKIEILQEMGFAVSEVIEIDNVEAERQVYEFKQDADHLQQIEVLKEQEIAENEVIEINNVEAESEVYDSDHLQQIEVLQKQEIAESDVIENDFNQDGLIEDDDSDTDEIAEEIKTTDVLIKLASFDPTLGLLIGLSIPILTLFSVFYHSKRTKSSTSSVSATVAQENNVAEKQKTKILNLEPIASNESTEPLVNTDSLQNDESKEISHIHAPSVELLGEFVFGEELTSSAKTHNISVSPEDDTTVFSIRTKLSHMKMSSDDSHTVKKQKQKNSEVSVGSSMVTPSPVRRSSRLRSRSVASP